MSEDPSKPVLGNDTPDKTKVRKRFAKVVIEHPNGKMDFEIFQDDTVKDVILTLVRVRFPKT